MVQYSTSGVGRLTGRDAKPLALAGGLRYNTTMAIVGIFWWWYGAGWKAAVRRVQSRLVGVLDYFSIDLLLRTLFSPFRQISAGAVDGPLPVKLRAFFDKLLSRIIGAIVRTIVMIIGLVAIAIGLVLGLCVIVGWALVPLLPLVGLTLTLTGWMPWM